MTKRIIAITGAGGFVGQHLRAWLAAQEQCELRVVDRSAWDVPAQLDAALDGCDAVVHLAAMNRGEDAEVYATNVALATKLVASLERLGARPHVLFSSSTQRDTASRYGASKLEAEDRLRSWSVRCAAPLSILVIPNLYGAGCRPFYNSVVATFCHQLVQGEQPRVIEDREVPFLWVGELVDRIGESLASPPSRIAVKRMAGEPLMVSGLLDKLSGFRDSYLGRGVVPKLASRFDSTLYSTFLSYVDPSRLRLTPEVKADHRGDLCEVIKLAAGGQVFFSTTRPGVVRGNHYHTRKIEQFCVLRGEAVIRVRPVHSAEVTEYRVSGLRPEYISIPVMHTHNIENVGNQELLTLFWTSEVFDPSDPDTIYETVEASAGAGGPQALLKAG